MLQNLKTLIDTAKYSSFLKTVVPVDKSPSVGDVFLLATGFNAIWRYFCNFRAQSARPYRGTQFGLDRLQLTGYGSQVYLVGNRQAEHQRCHHKNNTKVNV